MAVKTGLSAQNDLRPEDHPLKVRKLPSLELTQTNGNPDPNSIKKMRLRIIHKVTVTSYGSSWYNKIDKTFLTDVHNNGCRCDNGETPYWLKKYRAD